MTEPPAGPPAWATESVRLSAYDPRWPGQAARYAAELRAVLGPWLLSPVEHVGSTAVPGLVAKRVIDLMAAVADPDTVIARTGAQLSERDWSHVPPDLFYDYDFAGPSVVAFPPAAARYLQECLPVNQYWDVPVAEQSADTAPARVIDFLASLAL